MRTVHAPEHDLSLAVAFLNHWESEYLEFKEIYNPKTGFYFYKQAEGEKDTYFLCCGNIKYRLTFFKNYDDVVAFRPERCYTMAQRDTADLATKAIRITGLDESCFCTESQARALSPRTFRVALKTLDALLPPARKAKAAPEKPDKCWEELYKITTEKQAFASNFLIRWPYLSLDMGQNRDGDYTCKFQIAPLDQVIKANEARFNAFRKENGLVEEDKSDNETTGTGATRKRYIEAFSAGARVEIPLNRQPDSSGKQQMLFGTVVKLDLPGVEYDSKGKPKLTDGFLNKSANFTKPWTLELAVMDGSKYTTDDIPRENGILGERISTDYKNTLKALQAMYSLGIEQCWDSAQQVLVHHQAPTPGDEIQPEYSSPNLTPKQKEAIKMALNTRDFCLIQGPPGTGKTTIITEMVRNFMKQNKRVLICSKGNLAVDNVLEKWIKENKGQSESHLCVRLGKNFQLPFLSAYTPENITVIPQMAVYNKTQQERERLAAQVTEKIRLVEANRAGVGRLTEQAIAACQLYEALEALWPIHQKACRIKPQSEVLRQKLQNTELAMGMVYQELILPCHRFLCSEASPTREQLDRFNLHYGQAAHKILAALAEYKPGFLEKLRLGKAGSAWAGAEEELRRKSQDFYHNPQLKGNALRANPLLSVPALKATLSADPNGNLPPRQRREILTRFRDSLNTFSQRESYRLNKILNVLNKWLQELGSGVSGSLERDLVMQSIPLIGATCMGVMSDDDFKGITFDVVIVDEAGQIPIFDLIVPLIRAKKVILIGDHIQLPPMDEQDFAAYYAAKVAGNKKGAKYQEEKKAIQKRYAVSTFQTLFEQDSLKSVQVTLDTQYRCHPAISNFVAQTFYSKDTYKAGVTPQSRTLQVAGFDKPLYFFDTCDLPAEVYDPKDPKSLGRFETDHDPGYSNEMEARKVAQVLTRLILAIREGSGDSEKLILRDKATNQILGYDIGVISGYNKQVERIHTLTTAMLTKHMEPEEAKLHMSRFSIASVDSFQGRDNQVIIFSMTRSNGRGKVGFLQDVRRLNVAMTRAKSLLIMVGDSSTLTRCKGNCTHDESKKVATIYQDLVDYCDGNNEDKAIYRHKLKGEDLLGTN